MLCLVMKPFLTSQDTRIPTMWRYRICKILMPQFTLVRVCPMRFKVHFYLFKNCNQKCLLRYVSELVMPLLNENFGEIFIFQQDGVPPHYHNAVTRFLNVKILRWWTGCGGPMAWPPWSPDLISMYFFLWGCIKDQVKVSPLPSNLQEIKKQDLSSCGVHWYR
jgi:hypothetical protein